MERNIMHLDLDTFFVSCERLHNRALINKPILIGGNGERGVVASCSYEARGYGVHSAMPMRRAKELCPEAIIIRGDMDDYSKKSAEVTQVISDYVPTYEKSSIDEFYIDLTGMDRFFGCYKLASEIRQKVIKETMLPLSFGLSTNKTVSKIGTGEAKPNGQKKIAFGTEKLFLAPLSIKKIPMVGDKTYHLLRNMGIERILTLQEMPLELLEKVLGKNGHVIWKKAQGIDNSPVVPYSERKSISTERTFNKDTIDTEKLKSIIIGMTERLAFQLRTENKLTGCIAVKIRYSDFNTYTQQIKIPYTSLDQVLIDHAKDLLNKLYQKRLLVRLVGVKFSHLVQGNYQLNLFENSEKQLMLYQAMDKMRNQYGKYSVQRAVGMDIKNPDFNVFNPKKINH
jgi:DNA polymerase-4